MCVYGASRVNKMFQGFDTAYKIYQFFYNPYSVSLIYIYKLGLTRFREGRIQDSAVVRIFLDTLSIGRYFRLSNQYS